MARSCPVPPSFARSGVGDSKGIALTDHDTTRYATKFSTLLHEAGLAAIPGEEVRASNGAEILCYFITATIRPKMHWTEILDEVRSQGAIAVLSHPFDYMRGNWMAELSAKHRDTRLALLRGVDGLETFNARNYSPGGNWLAHRYASAAGLRETAGSDAHALFELGLTWTEVDAASSDPDDLLAAFTHGNLVPHVREELGAVPVPGYTARLCGRVRRQEDRLGIRQRLPPVQALAVEPVRVGECRAEPASQALYSTLTIDTCSSCSRSSPRKGSAASGSSR